MTELAAGLAPPQVEHLPVLVEDLEANHDVIVFSGHHRIRKPDPEIYQLTLDQLQLSASACIFVDDDPNNLIPAQKLGMATVHATTAEETVNGLQKLVGIPLG
ncbi:HAD-IA family hydrolase [Streptomyces sp. NPDC085540]|uniref:HAD-IA family hydrolase n=1 Tax=Streptomyces sp. NPDC085540 TaxID=3365730 RepID=UPI0037CEA3B0